MCQGGGFEWRGRPVLDVDAVGVLELDPDEQGIEVGAGVESEFPEKGSDILLEPQHLLLVQLRLAIGVTDRLDLDRHGGDAPVLVSLDDPIDVHFGELDSLGAGGRCDQGTNLLAQGAEIVRGRIVRVKESHFWHRVAS